MDRSPTVALRAVYAALEAGVDGESLRSFFTEDAVTIEHPNRLKPKGAVSTLEVMLENVERGRTMLATQRYHVEEMVEVGERVVVRLTWTGTMAIDVGELRAGQVLTAQVAQFVQVRDGRVSRLETYDCYYPFEA